MRRVRAAPLIAVFPSRRLPIGHILVVVAIVCANTYGAVGTGVVSAVCAPSSVATSREDFADNGDRRARAWKEEEEEEEATATLQTLRHSDRSASELNDNDPWLRMLLDNPAGVAKVDLPLAPAGVETAAASKMNAADEGAGFGAGFGAPASLLTQPAARRLGLSLQVSRSRTSPIDSGGARAPRKPGDHSDPGDRILMADGVGDSELSSTPRSSAEAEFARASSDLSAILGGGSFAGGGRRGGSPGGNLDDKTSSDARAPPRVPLSLAASPPAPFIAGEGAVLLDLQRLSKRSAELRLEQSLITMREEADDMEARLHEISSRQEQMRRLMSKRSASPRNPIVAAWEWLTGKAHSQLQGA